MMTRTFSLTSAAAVSLSLLLVVVAQQARAAEMLDHIVAVVDEDVILASELDQAVDGIRSQIRASGNEMPPEDVLTEQVRERLILQKLQLQRAALRGIQVSDEELNNTLNDLAARNQMNLRQFAAAVRTQGMDYLALRDQIREELLIQQLRAQEVESRVVVSERDVNDLLKRSTRDEDTEYRVAQILVAVPDGASDAIRREARAEATQIAQSLQDGADFNQLAIARSDGQGALEGGDLGWRPAGALPTIFANVAKRMNVGDTSGVLESGSGFHVIRLSDKRGSTDVQMVTETRARHILLQPNALRDESESMELLADLRERLRNGEDFETLAKEFSDDPGSANQGGDLGYRIPGSFVPAFEEKIGDLEIDEISEPFRSRFGMHIVQVLDRRERNTAEDIRQAKAREAIRRRKVSEEYENWVRRIRAESFVELRAEPTPEEIEALRGLSGA